MIELRIFTILVGILNATVPQDYYYFLINKGAQWCGVCMCVYMWEREREKLIDRSYEASGWVSRDVREPECWFRQGPPEWKKEVMVWATDTGDGSGACSGPFSAGACTPDCQGSVVTDLGCSMEDLSPARGARWQQTDKLGSRVLRESYSDRWTLLFLNKPSVSLSAVLPGQQFLVLFYQKEHSFGWPESLVSWFKCL